MAKEEEKNTMGQLGGGSLVYEVKEVYIYIPAEFSAARVELKISGSVVVVNKEEKFSLAWLPADLTPQDVACLYSAPADDWTLVDEPVEAPVVIETEELKYADKDYKGGGLELPESIVPSEGTSGAVESEQKVEESKDAAAAVHPGAEISANKPGGHLDRATTDAVNFDLSQLHSIRETTAGYRCLTFILRSGQELAGLHFHDGGTSGLLQALQRYLYLERDHKFPLFYFVKNFSKSDSHKSKSVTVDTSEEDIPVEFRTITPHGVRGSRAMEVQGLIHGAVSGVVGNFVGITRAVRQHLTQDKQLLEVRPGTEDYDDDEQVIQSCVYSDTKVSTSTKTSDKKNKPPRPPPPNTEVGRGLQPVGGGNQEAGPGAAKKKDKKDPEASLISDFQIITDIRGKLPPLPMPLPRQPPVSSDEWERMRDDEGRISVDKEQQLRARIFAGGVELKLRREAWKYLLNYHRFGMSDLQRMEHRQEKEREYWNMNAQWKAFSKEQERRFSAWRETKSLINKDVLRTDRDCSSYSSLTSPKLRQMEDILRTYAMYNFDLGYVQGMSDLLAPLLVIMDNEVDTFWCFVGFMETVEHHFEASQEGMRNRLKQLRALLNIIDPQLYQFLKEKESNNLYFCFRWLLIHFKREFTYEDIMRMWEVIWTGHLSSDYSLFIALAILETEKKELLNPNYDFSDILQYINGLTKKISVAPVLEMAEAICTQLGTSCELPDNLQPLVKRPLPSRPSLSSIPRVDLDTVVCNPEGRAVPSTQT